MDYIISPWVFYWLSVVSELDTITRIASMLSFLTLILFVVVKTVFSLEIATPKKDRQTVHKLYKLFLVLTLILTFVAILCPSKTTCYQMIAASTITESRVCSFIKQGQLMKDELKSDIIDIIVSTTENLKKDPTSE